MNDDYINQDTRSPKPWVEGVVRVLMFLMGLFVGALGVGLIGLLKKWPWYFYGMFTNFTLVHVRGLNIVGFAAILLLSGIGLVVLAFGMRRICPRWPRLSLALIWLLPVGLFFSFLIGFGVTLLLGGVKEIMSTSETAWSTVSMLGISLALITFSYAMTKVSRKYRVPAEGAW